MEFADGHRATIHHSIRNILTCVYTTRGTRLEWGIGHQQAKPNEANTQLRMNTISPKYKTAWNTMWAFCEMKERTICVSIWRQSISPLHSMCVGFVTLSQLSQPCRQHHNHFTITIIQYVCVAYNDPGGNLDGLFQVAHSHTFNIWLKSLTNLLETYCADFTHSHVHHDYAFFEESLILANILITVWCHSSVSSFKYSYELWPSCAFVLTHWMLISSIRPRALWLSLVSGYYSVIELNDMASTYSHRSSVYFMLDLDYWTNQYCIAFPNHLKSESIPEALKFNKCDIMRTTLNESWCDKSFV